jgi:very-short-patch-repair endonuclease
MKKITHLLPQIVSKPEKLIISDKCRVQIKCQCGVITDVSVRNLTRKWRDREYKCKSCSVKSYINNLDRIKKFQKSFSLISGTAEHKKKCSDGAKKLWTNQETRQKIGEAVRHDNATNPLKIAGLKKACVAWHAKYGEDKMEEMRRLARQSFKKHCEDPEFRATITKRLTDAWENPASREKHRKATILETTKRWEDPEYRAKMMTVYTSEDNKKEVSERFKHLWKDETWRSKMMKTYQSAEWKKACSERSREVLSRPEVLQKLAIARANTPRVSKLENELSKILTDLKIEHKRQYIIGHYTFDFMLPRINKIPLLIEVQGTYFHSLPEVQVRDRQKHTYISKYFEDQYDLKYIWEHELKCVSRIQSLLQYWMGTPLLNIQVDFAKIEIKEITRELAVPFLGLYHYMGGVGRHGLYIGAFYENQLIAVSAFAPIIRKETATRLNLTSSNVKELSRFCIHPVYQQKNLASWFLAKSIKLFHQQQQETTHLIAFADEGFNHLGTIYKATNWIIDGVVDPSYWYVDKDGYVMHKKTLYNKAVNQKMKEVEFADKFQYTKVIGKKKFRFIYPLKNRELLTTGA